MNNSKLISYIGSVKRVPFRVQLALLSLIFIALVSTVTWIVVSKSQTQLIEHETLKIAEIVATQAAKARAVYSEIAVSKLKQDGFGASIDSIDKPGHIPLPAQFLKALSRKSSQDSGGLYRFKPISEWNLAPDQGLTDDFQRWAWSELKIQDKVAPSEAIDWQPVWRVEDVEGVSTLRYLRADPASGASCVNCHNQFEKYPETIATRIDMGVEPGHQWNLHELLGAVEIRIPLNVATALAKEQTQDGLMIILAVTIIGLAGVAFIIFIDSARTRSMTEKLSWQARHDSLTKLPNRVELESVLGTLLREPSNVESHHAVMLLDLNNFKQINDTLGHGVGDVVLIKTADRLRHALSNRDFVCRLGGDEFAVILPDSNQDRAQQVALSLSSAIDQEYEIGEYRLTSGVSIGIAMTPKHADASDELLRCADVAMYAAKQSNQSYTFYDALTDNNHVSRLALINDLGRAIQEGSLSLHYQPKYHLLKSQMVGVEALVRWNHPHHGNIPAQEIIQIAERSGLIGELTHWVLITAMIQCKQWRDAGYDLNVSVNLSAANLHDAKLINEVKSALQRTGQPPNALILEVTEGAMMLDPTRACAVLTELRSLGVLLSVDDYGTGYCSLSYLNELPVHELKLDKSFIKNLFNGDKDAIIVNATVELAHRLNLQIVAEGVEDASALDYLREIGCDVVQGYFLCRPIVADELTARLPSAYRFKPFPEIRKAG